MFLQIEAAGVEYLDGCSSGLKSPFSAFLVFWDLSNELFLKWHSSGRISFIFPYMTNLQSYFFSARQIHFYSLHHLVTYYKTFYWCYVASCFFNMLLWFFLYRSVLLLSWFIALVFMLFPFTSRRMKRNICLHNEKSKRPFIQQKSFFPHSTENFIFVSSIKHAAGFKRHINTQNDNDIKMIRKNCSERWAKEEGCENKYKEEKEK